MFWFVCVSVCETAAVGLSQALCLTLLFVGNKKNIRGTDFSSVFGTGGRTVSTQITDYRLLQEQSFTEKLPG